MAVTLELRCASHGPYEHHEKACPWGCPPDWVTQEFRTPFAIQSFGTKFADQQLRGFAKDFKLRDIKTDKEGGTSVMDNIRKGQPNTFDKDGNRVYAPTTMPVPHMAPGWTRRGEKPTTFGGVYGMGENAIQHYREHAAPKLGDLTQPKPAFVNPPNPHAFK